MMNKFMEAMQNEAHITMTENGHDALNTTGSKVLDYYGQAGALRNRDEHEIIDIFLDAYREDPLMAMKALFYTRDIRGGVGERRTFRWIIRRLAHMYPDVVRKNLHLIPEFGRWDDLYALVETPIEDDIFEIIRKQLDKDLVSIVRGEPVSLMGKWLPSENASCEETKRLARLTMKKFEYRPKDYRHVLTALRKAIGIVETQMSSDNWDKIDYGKLPSKAGLIYKEAFNRHDKKRYENYIQEVLEGKAKINTATNTPQDLIHGYFSVRHEDPTIEAMWKNLPDYIDSDENVLVMADVSGSMTGRPMEISVGLAIYFAQRNRGTFHNLFMTFSGRPQFVELKDEWSLFKNLHEVERAGWGFNTDLDLACSKILDMGVKNHIPASDMPTRLIIISDMEIDQADRDGLHSEVLRKRYEEAGYSMPQLVYWNADARHNHFQTKSDTPGVMLASGASPVIFKSVMAMDDLTVDPYTAMIETLNSERYSVVRV